MERKECEENRRPRRVQRFARVELEGDVAHRTVVLKIRRDWNAEWAAEDSEWTGLLRMLSAVLWMPG